MTSAVARLLKDFGETTPASARGRVASDAGVVAPQAIAHVPDLEAEREAAFAAGRAAAEAECRAEAEADRRALEDDHAAALAALAESHAAEKATLVAETLASLPPQAVAAVSDAVARLLAPLLEEVVARRMIEALAADLAAALAERGATAVSVTGPRVLFDRLEACPELESFTLTHVDGPADRTDLAFEIAGTTVETRLAAFAARLSEALA